MATFYKRILGNVYGGQKAIIDIRKKENRHAWTLKNSSLYTTVTRATDRKQRMRVERN